MKSELTRREFLTTSLAGTGLCLAVSILPDGIRILSAAEAERMTAFEPNAYLHISVDDTITVIVNKSEMGQGVYTSLPMIIADELEADWKQVRFQPAPASDEFKDPVWGMQSTGGSTSIRHMYDALRKAGASAREMLIMAGAQALHAPLQECAAITGVVRHMKTGKGLSYGKLVFEASRIPAPRNPTLKKESQFKYIGKTLPRLDVPEKSMGTAGFGIDVFVPGMLYAYLARPPVYGAEVRSYDTAAAKKVKGVAVVAPIGSGIAVCADTIDAAWKGRDLLSARWGDPKYPALSTESLEKTFTAKISDAGVVAKKTGDAKAALQAAKTRVQASYLLPYLAHATMEPMNCTASVTADRCDVWVPTQNQGGVKNLALKLTGLKPDQVFVHTTYLGGGFGRRFEQDFVEEALLASLATGRPVKLLWSREEDMRHDFYRPANYTAIEAALDSSGQVTAWSHKIVCPSIFARVFPGMMRNGIDSAAVEGVENMEYDIPNFLAEYVRIDLPVPVGFWRSVGSSHNAFVVESFVDELAHQANKDPLEFRLGLLKNHPRARKVLELAADKAGWGKQPKQGQAMGIAYHLSFGTYVAEVAEVSVDKGGRIKVHKVTCAVDCGTVVNPFIVTTQMESGIIMGLSAALKEKVEFANGGVTSENFADYSVLRMSDVPDIEVQIVQSKQALGGVGEPGVPPAAPAVANAVFRAVGARLRQLPMTPAAVSAAMRAEA